MDRRQFMASCGMSVAATGSASGLEAERGARAAQTGPRMHLGTQQAPTSAPMLEFLQRHGVQAVCGFPPTSPGKGYWTREDLERTRDLCAKHRIALEMVALPLLSASHIDRERRGAIVLGQDPDRQRDVDNIHRMIAACAQAGIPAFKYNLSLLGVLRTGSTPGRGGLSYSTWRLRDATADAPLTRAGKVSDDLFWERITWFLDRVIPVCTENKIRAACHPHDPGVPPQGFQGVSRVLGTPEGLKRFVSIQESPYHGLNFCVGTVACMLRDPPRQIDEIVRYFGARKKIFNVHFRNIRGRRDDFQEVCLDEGDVDMVRVALALREVGYTGMLMPDHVPGHPDDPGSRQAFAFGYGYIKGVLQSIEALP